MSRDADVAVIGAGIAGAATARALARSGRAVVVLEQLAAGHDRGSSHGRSRIFRLGYADGRWVRLALEADALWRELEADAGETLTVRTGALDVGAAALDVAGALAGAGVEHELLDGAAAARRWPLGFAAGEPVCFHPAGGISLADRCLAALLDGAVAAGAVIVEHARVVSIEPGTTGVVVRAGGLEVRCGAVVVAAGAWARPLVARIGVGLETAVTRETVSYFALPSGEELPSLIDWASRGEPADGLARPGVAGFALAAPGVGLKAGLHHAGPAADPDEPGAPDAAVARWTAAWIRGRYGDEAGSPVAHETCLYTSTPDESFVLERHGRVVLGSACSGHGFKFAPVVGARLAALAGEALERA